MLIERDVEEYLEQRKIGRRGSRKTLVTVQTSHKRPVKGKRNRCKWYEGKDYDFLPLDLLPSSSFLCPFFFYFFFSIDCFMDAMSQM